MALNQSERSRDATRKVLAAVRQQAVTTAAELRAEVDRQAVELAVLRPLLLRAGGPEAG